MRQIFFTTCLLALSGCATLSFTPPIVDMKDKLEAHRNQTTFDAVCTPQFATDERGYRQTIYPNVDGALALIDNYILTYRCQRDRASEGRQYFDVSSFVALAGGATAAAFGAPAGVAIGTGAASAAIGSGKGYYSPVEKSKVLSDGITAMLCIHNEAVGIDGPTLEAISQVQNNSGNPAPTQPQNTAATGATSDQLAEEAGPSIPITSERQYFNMISTALWSVEQVMADRLRDYGKQFDMSGVQAELDKLKQETADKTKAAGTPAQAAESVTKAPSPPPPAPGTASLANGAVAPDTSSTAAKRLASFNEGQAKINAIGTQQVGQTVIQLKTLKPKLDQCIVKAKV